MTVEGMEASNPVIEVGDFIKGYDRFTGKMIAGTVTEILDQGYVIYSGRWTHEITKLREVELLD